MKQLNPIRWAILPLKKYATFSGRAPRAEYWWFNLAAMIAGLGTDYLDSFFSVPVVGVYGPVSLVFTLALIVPSVAVTVRRLHDSDRTGWWAVMDVWNYSLVIAGFSGLSIETAMKSIGLVPALMLILLMLSCGVILFIFMVTPGTKRSNEYGPDPYGASELEEVFA